MHGVTLCTQDAGYFVHTSRRHIHFPCVSVAEMAWNYGTEKQEGKVYHNGNDQPQGFGHVCVSVDDLNAACQR